MRSTLVLAVMLTLLVAPACKSKGKGIGMAIDLAPRQHGFARATGGGQLRCRNLGPGDAEIAWTSDPERAAGELDWRMLRVFDERSRRVGGDLTLRVRALESTTSVGIAADPGTSLDAKAVPAGE